MFKTWRRLWSSNVSFERQRQQNVTANKALDVLVTSLVDQVRLISGDLGFGFWVSFLSGKFAFDGKGSNFANFEQVILYSSSK